MTFLPENNSNARYLVSVELNPEQLALLENIERLAELDPELTDRLARTLDRIQRSQPYQRISGSATREERPTPPKELSAAERALREEYITQELSALLVIAGQLSQKYNNLNTREARPDQHFRNSLRDQLFGRKPQNPA